MPWSLSIPGRNWRVSRKQRRGPWYRLTCSWKRYPNRIHLLLVVWHKYGSSNKKLLISTYISIGTVWLSGMCLVYCILFWKVIIAFVSILPLFEPFHVCITADFLTQGVAIIFGPFFYSYINFVSNDVLINVDYIALSDIMFSEG